MTYANSRSRASAEGNSGHVHGKADGYGLGLHANFTKGRTGWANVGGSWGSQDYPQYVARAGVKYTW